VSSAQSKQKTLRGGSDRGAVFDERSSPVATAH